MKFPQLNAFAKAQAWGLAVGFALALWTADKLSYSVGIFILGTAAAWIGWEFFLGPRAPSHRTDIPAMVYGITSGFVLPWAGFGLAALAAAQGAKLCAWN
jgi:hypothetical protein